MIRKSIFLLELRDERVDGMRLCLEGMMGRCHTWIVNPQGPGMHRNSTRRTMGVTFFKAKGIEATRYNSTYDGLRGKKKFTMHSKSFEILRWLELTTTINDTHTR